MPRSHHSERLESRAREIVGSLGGTWRRNRGMCRCPAHDDRTPSLSVSLGRRAILLHCFAGCSNGEVIAALGRRGVRARDLFGGSGEPFPVMPRKAAVDRSAIRLWRGAAALTGSPAETYLLKRGLTQFSSDLRFHPRTPLGPRGAAKFLPAMLAAVRTDLGVIAVHRTFLDAQAGGLAAFERPKRALGSLQQGAVRLARPRGGRLGLAEGIETALSAMQLFGVPCWATLGSERFGRVTIPESVRELHLFLDNDPGGDLAEERARNAYSCDGRDIVATRPTNPDDDWNDVLTDEPLVAGCRGESGGTQWPVP
jgi:putative DNA primase/helicase